MGGTNKNFKLEKLFTILGVLLAIVITVLSSSYIIAGELTAQLQHNLEDVENQLQLTYLKELRCDAILGFLFARPMPSSQFEELL